MTEAQKKVRELKIKLRQLKAATIRIIAAQQEAKNA